MKQLHVEVGTKMRMKEYDYWGERARSYDTATAYVVGEKTRRETKKWLADQIKATDDVLELGCGTGQFSEVIAGKARHLTAADGALKMLDMTRLRLSPFSNTIIQLEGCYRTTYPDGAFDVVFLGNVIHILGQPIRATNRRFSRSP